MGQICDIYGTKTFAINLFSSYFCTRKIRTCIMLNNKKFRLCRKLKSLPTLRDVIDTWRSALIGLTEEEALEMNSFFFDFDWIRPIEVYMDLTNLIINDGLLTTMSQLAHYMAMHSNLSKSEATLYALLKRYKRICLKK